MRYTAFLTTIFVLCFCTSCDNSYIKEQQLFPNSSNTVLPSSTGNVSEIVLVIKDELWKGALKESLENSLQPLLKGIPQAEVLFDVVRIAPSDFSNIFKTHKNIIWISLSENAIYDKTHQKWSKDQLFVTIAHHSIELLTDLILSKSVDLQHEFLIKDKARRVSKLSTARDRRIEEEIQSKFNLQISIPQGYKIAESEPEFIWLRKDEPSLNTIHNLWIHKEHYERPHQLSKEKLIQLRDSLGVTHVEGASTLSYMATELLYEPEYKLISEKPYCIETRGLWTMVNDFLGGPYIAHAYADLKNEKLIYIEGFMYCPNERKRKHIHNLEAIFATVKLEE